MSEIYILVSRTDGSVAHVAFQTEGRFPSRPLGGWTKAEGDQLWRRVPTDANIEFELSRVSRTWARLGDPTLVSWRQISPAEHAMFNQNRQHRDALEDVNGKLQHNMVKARELHRALIRHVNGSQFLTLDREWVSAFARNDLLAAAAVEAKRQAMRNVVNDPRIEAAKNIEELLVVVPIEG